jgi:hypothetical protein
MRQKTVLHAIVSAIFRLIGGDAWTRAESSVVGTTRALSDLTRYVSQRREDAAFLSALEADWDGFTKADSKDRVRRLTALAQRYRLVPGVPSRLSGGTTAVGKAAEADDATSVIECALRLASDPASLDPQDDNLRMTISRLLDAPSLARAARLLVIVVDRAQASRTAPGEAYAGWSWR